MCISVYISGIGLWISEYQYVFGIWCVFIDILLFPSDEVSMVLDKDYLDGDLL